MASSSLVIWISNTNYPKVDRFSISEQQSDTDIIL